jgi:hypothetical protein
MAGNMTDDSCLLLDIQINKNKRDRQSVKGIHKRKTFNVSKLKIRD